MRPSTSREDPSSSNPDAVLRALADPHRRRILQLVKDHELAAGQIASSFEITQQAVSQHLRLLEDAGLLRVRREGPKRLYVLQPEALEAVRVVLGELWPDALQRLKQAVEQRPKDSASATPTSQQQRPKTP